MKCFRILFKLLSKLRDLLKPALVLMLISSLKDFCSALLKINRLDIPDMIENGTQDSVVLDCVYSFDKIEDRNLVVKWFFEDDPEPIYQFIAEYGTRHYSQRLKGRINLNYTVGDEDYIKYRALSLFRPTIDFSGKYSCHVQSLAGLDVRESSMIVYAKPKNIEFSYKAVTRKEFTSALRKHKSKYILSDESYSNDEQQYSSSSSEVQCKVSDVYPLPELTIYRTAADGTQLRTLDIYRKDSKESPTGAYDASVSVFINDRDLIQKYGNEPSIFECLVAIYQISYENRSQIEYFPVNEEIPNLSADSKVYYTLFTIVSTFMYLCFKLNINEL